MKNVKEMETQNIWTKASAKRELENQYNVPGSPIAFASANKIFNYFRKILSIEEIGNFLSSKNTHTLFRENRKRARQHVPIQVYEKRQLIEGDLIDVSAVSKVYLFTFYFLFLK